MGVLPLRINAHWDEGHKGKAALGMITFAILMGYALASSIGFGMQNRSQLAGSAENLAAQLEDAVADRDQAVRRLNRISEDLRLVQWEPFSADQAPSAVLSGRVEFRTAVREQAATLA
jgi:hypothetical protein